MSGRDRPGLLYDLTSAISDLSLDIASAHITTFGEKAVDVFYVTDLTGKQIISEVRQKAIRERLTGVLQAGRTGHICGCKELTGQAVSCLRRRTPLPR